MGTKRQAAENEDAVRPDTHTMAPPLLEVSGLVKRYSNTSTDMNVVLFLSCNRRLEASINYADN